MKIGIMSDCHLGERKFRARTENGDQNLFSSLNYKCWQEAIGVFKERKIDNVIIGGDLFESHDPEIEAILEGIKIKQIPNVFLPGGNHEFSQHNNIRGIHPFNVLDLKYATNSYMVCEENPDFDITLIAYKNLLPEVFEKIESKKDGKTKILVCHGQLDCETKEYNVPKTIVKNYDLIIIGHVHIANLVESRNRKILTPGSLMPSNQAYSLTGDSRGSIWIYDTETFDIERIFLNSSPMVFDVATDDLNKELKKILDTDYEVPPIYNIHKYGGEVKEVDPVLYKQAHQKCLNLSIQVNDVTMEELSVSNNQVENFFDWIGKEHPGWLEEFEEICK